MTRWLLKCRECGQKWILEVSFNLREFSSGLYHYCPYCRRNTFHDIVGTMEDQQGESSSQR